MREHEINQRMEGALRDPFPAKALASLARSLKTEGMSQLEMYRFFDDFRDRHEIGIAEDVYDAILEAMDLISGWCAPGAQIFGANLRV